MEQKKLTGYPSIDKPWLKYYKPEDVKRKLESYTIYQYLYESNKNHPNDIALIYYGRKITYQKLLQQIRCCANSLAALGVKQGDIISIQALAFPQTVILLYAASFIGAVANFISVADDEASVCAMLCDTNTRVFFVLDGVWKNYDPLTNTAIEHIIPLTVDAEMDWPTKTLYRIATEKRQTDHSGKRILLWAEFMKLGGDQRISCVKDENLSVAMIYTGGTTGKSKAVVLSNRGMNAIASQYGRARMGIIRQKMFMDSLPPFIAFGLTVTLHMPLVLGLKTALIPDPAPQNQGKMFMKYRPNFYVASPLQIEAIFNHPKAQKTDFSFLTVLGTGGDSLPNTTRKNINTFLSAHNSPAEILQGYGMSELSAGVCTETPVAKKAGTVGIPLPDVNVKIVHEESGKEVPFGEQGEIYIQSPSVMIGYYHLPEETEQTLQTDCAGKKWVRTGDIGVMDEDGYLTIVGRIKRIITISDGSFFHKVFPKLLEEKLETIEGVHEAAIVSNGTYVDKQTLFAYVVTEQKDTAVLEERLRSFSSVHFKDYEQPQQYRFVSELPRTKIGKVDYRALEQMAADTKKE